MKKIRKQTFIAFILNLFLILMAKGQSQAIGGGSLNLGIYTNEESIEKFQDMRIGFSIHWGPAV